MIGSVEPLIVNDSVDAAAFAGIPAVAQFGMRSYIGVPIVLSSGQVYGTLCALDRSPRMNDEADLDMLLILARLLASQLDRRELGVLEERQRVAREIHDTIAQSLAALILDLSLHAGEVRDVAPGLEPDVAQLLTRARDTLREVRRSIWNLQPGALDGRTLAGALERELLSLRAGGIETAIEVRGMPRELPPALEAALLRIAQEAIANARRHAGARAVIVTLDFGDDLVTLRVEDDGRGIDLARVAAPTLSSGFGLTSMRERARTAGGDLTVELRPAGGTAVVCALPTMPGHPDARAEPASDARGARLTRVLLVDDHLVVREGIRRLLEGGRDVTIVGEANAVPSALALLARQRPDVVLLDLQLGDRSGLDVLDALPTVSPASRAIVLSTWSQDEMIYQALRAGARGYLLKDATRDELVRAIATVASGGTLITPVVAQRLAEIVHRPEQLTPREREVLGRMADGLRNKEIAIALGMSEKTVEFHAANLFGKLGVTSRTEAVRAAIERGLVLSPAR